MSARHGGSCTCPYCTPAPAATVSAVPEPIELPDRPTLIRVHTADFPPMDCTLHPDGTLTRVAANGELLRNFLTFADMRERGWRDAHVEFHPGPLPVEPEPAPMVRPEAVQDAMPLEP